MKISPKAALKKLLRMLVIILICVSLVALSLNFYILSASAPDIFSLEENPAGAYDAILILGCSVHANGNPSAMLKDRLERGDQPLSSRRFLQNHRLRRPRQCQLRRGQRYEKLLHQPRRAL